MSRSTSPPSTRASRMRDAASRIKEPGKTPGSRPVYPQDDGNTIY
jgi:hypothetical protein